MCFPGGRVDVRRTRPARVPRAPSGVFDFAWPSDRLASDQHATVELLDDVVGDAPEQERLRLGEASAADHDGVGVEIVSDVDDDPTDLSARGLARWCGWPLRPAGRVGPRRRRRARPRRPVARRLAGRRRPGSLRARAAPSRRRRSPRRARWRLRRRAGFPWIHQWRAPGSRTSASLRSVMPNCGPSAAAGSRVIHRSGMGPWSFTTRSDARRSAAGRFVGNASGVRQGLGRPCSGPGWKGSDRCTM